MRRTYGEFLLAAGDFRGASDAYGRLLQTLPDDAQVLNNMAFSLNKLGDEGAVDYARRAIEIAPDSASYNDTMGWILVGNERPAEALAYLREARARDYRSALIRYHLAVCLRDLDRVEEAATELAAALDGDTRFDGYDDALLLQSELRARLAAAGT